MSLRRYQGYRDSGVEWLGDVPSDWPVQPLKTIASFINGEAFKPSEWSDRGTPIIRIQNLNGGDDFNCYEGSVDTRYHVSSGDLLFGWSGNRGTSFGPFRWSRAGLYYLNQHIFRVDAGGSHPGWLYWCLKGVTGYVEQQAHGIIGMVHITQGKLGAICVPVPNRAEQVAIAAFLDRETAKIDALVEEQRRLIDLLKEKRQAVISHAVTRGLDPSAPMKGSGIKWLGEVPAHWEVTALKRLCVLITDGAHISPETDGGVYCFVSTRDISDENIDFEGCLKTSPANYEYLVRTGCRPALGDVLFSKDGTIGRTVVVRDDLEFVVASSLIIIRPEPDVLDADFLHFLCQAECVQGQVESFVKGAGLPRLSIQNLLRVVGVFPPRNEQIAIVRYLHGEVSNIRALIEAAVSAIELLHERRAALISAAVTGKIDVRDTAAAQAALEPA